MTLAWNGADTERAFGSMFHGGMGAKYINLPIAHYATYHYDSVETPTGEARAVAAHGVLGELRSMLSIATVDEEFAEPGTEVAVVWGEPTPSSKVAVEDHVQVKIRATVNPAPIDLNARSQYRRNAVGCTDLRQSGAIERGRNQRSRERNTPWRVPNSGQPFGGAGARERLLARDDGQGCPRSDGGEGGFRPVRRST